MDGLFDQYSNGPVGLVILLPVIAAVVAVVLVFVFGFKSPDGPKFKKTQSTNVDGTKKPRRKEKKQLVTNGQLTGQQDVPTKRETAAKQTAEMKKSPVKEVRKKQADIETPSPVKKATPAPKVPLKLTTTTKKLPKEKRSMADVTKPADFDDGNWLTVSSKSDKKKRIEDSIAAVASILPSGEPSPQRTINTKHVATKSAANTIEKNAKQLKDQANKMKKDSADAAAAAAAATAAAIANVTGSSGATTTIAAIVPSAELSKTNIENQSSTGVVVDYEDPQTAEIIEKIQEAIVDIDMNLITSSGTTIADQLSEKLDKMKDEPIDTNVAFDELGDAWTEAKVLKKGKKKLRKD